MQLLNYSTKLFPIFILLFLSCKKEPVVEHKNGSDESVNYTVSTFAGKGINGTDPVTGSPALLYFPADMDFDRNGNLYVADAYNDRICKISPAGAMATFAGGTVGYADGAVATARFNHPTAIALDAQGNVYVAESGNLRIRKITPAGEVTTIAGSGVAGTADGIGTAAEINNPGGMLADAQGNIFFTQEGFHGIRKISPAGVVSTFVGSTTKGFVDATGTAARFNEAYSLTNDAQGNMYVSDFKNARIRKITPAGVVTTVIQRAHEDEMHDIALDALGNFYIVQGDIDVTEIVRVSPSGDVTKIAGGAVGYVDGPGNSAKFGYITALKVTANGDIYLSELFNDTVRKIRKN